MNIMEKGQVGRDAPDKAALIESAGWGLFFIWIGVALLADVGWGLALVGMGVISLGSQGVRRLSALKVDGWSMVIGTCLVLTGLAIWFPLPNRSWFGPAFFFVIGAVILAGPWMHRRKR